MHIRTFAWSLLILSSLRIYGTDPNHLIIPLNPKMTVTPTLTKATSLRLFGLILGVCASALVYDSLAHQKTASGPDHIHAAELSVGTICAVLSWLILHTMHDEQK